MIALDDVSGVVLAGGQGRRMQQPDTQPIEKGLVVLHDQPLVSWAVNALPSGLANIYISANRHGDAYSDYGIVVPDDPALGAGAGPLAGIASVMQHMTTPWLYVVPTDVPRPPGELFERLLHYVSVRGCELLYASTDKPQPLFMLVHARLLDSIKRCLRNDMRQVQRWQREYGLAVQFEGDNNEFFNINTPEDLCLAHQLIPPPGI